MSITNPQVVPPLRRHKLRPSRRKIQTVDALLYPHALITEPVVIQVSGLSGATLERQVHAGEFPAPRKFGRFKRWVAGEITDWLKAQADGRKWAAKSRDQSGDTDTRTTRTTRRPLAQPKPPVGTTRGTQKAVGTGTAEADLEH